MNNQPTVGSILHYFTAKSGPEAAIVTGVDGERVDIHVFGHGRPGFDRESVSLVAVSVDEETSWCQWPPRETHYAGPLVTLPDIPAEETPAVEEVGE